MTLPTLPQVWVDTTMPAPRSGATTHVCTSSAQFATALTNAVLGDIIELQAGTVFQGPFTLPNKTPAAHVGNPYDSEWIVIRSSAYASLPAEDTRVTPADAANMPKVQASASNESALYTATSAHHYRFVGIEFKPPVSTSVNSLVLLGSPLYDETSVAQLPHHLIFDRCYVHGDTGPTVPSHQGIVLNSATTGVIDSYFSDFKEEGFCLALVGWGGPGPFKIVNNYLEVSAINIMFGGATTLIPNLVPSDIEIRRNHFTKRVEWNPFHPSHDGSSWSGINQIEFKSGQRVLIDGNLFENHWAGHNTAIVLRVSNAEGVWSSGELPGTQPWAVTQDFTFTNNIVRHAAGGIQINGEDPTFPYGHGPTERTQRVLIKNNLFEDISSQWGGGGWLFYVTYGVEDLTTEHNTGLPNGSTLLAEIDAGNGPQPHIRTIFRNNLATHGESGAYGNTQLNSNFQSIVFVRNVLIGPYPTAGGYTPSSYSNYPDTLFPDTMNDVGFVNHAGGNYALTTGSPYHNAATDGADIGVDMVALNDAFSGDFEPPSVIVDFSASPLTGNIPLNVSFTDESTGTITDWDWDFGDGGTSTAQHPSHTYTVAGTYTVSLTVTGPDGSFNDTKAGYITASTVAKRVLVRLS